MNPLQLTELCKILNDAGVTARLEGNDRLVTAVNTLEDASDRDLSFLSNPKYAPTLKVTRASAVLVGEGVAVPSGVSAIRCTDPYAAVTVAIIKLHGFRQHPKWGISDRASIAESARIGANANIGPGAAIAANVVIGDSCNIYPGCYLGDRVRIGDGCTLYPNVVIYEGCELGDRVTIHAGSVIGEDGLGYAPLGEKWIKIPQVGRAVIGNDVEIGANCAIDRATLGCTQIGDGTKFSNVVVIGHGTKVGPDCLFVGLVGVAGSVTVGRHVTLAGQVGVSGHLSIGDNARVAAQSGISSNVEPGADLLGFPAMPVEQARRSYSVLQKLPKWVQRIKDLEREVRELKAKLGADGNGPA